MIWVASARQGDMRAQGNEVRQKFKLGVDRLMLTIQKTTTKQASNKDQPAKVVKQDDEAAALVKHSDQIAAKANGPQ